MNKENTEKELRVWFAQMTKKYGWLRIKFEFNDSRRVFMVSFSPVKQIELSDEFNLDAMHFADKLNNTYGEEAPLFTDEEALFNLSTNAEVIEAYSFISAGSPLTSETLITMPPQNDIELWVSEDRYTTAKTGKNFRQTSPEESYAFAA